MPTRIGSLPRVTLAKRCFTSPAVNGLPLPSGMLDIGRQPFGMGRQCIGLGIAADVDSGVTSLADQLRLKMVVALQSVIFALRFNLGFGSHDA